MLRTDLAVRIFLLFCLPNDGLSRGGRPSWGGQHVGQHGQNMPHRWCLTPHIAALAQNATLIRALAERSGNVDTQICQNCTRAGLCAGIAGADQNLLQLCMESTDHFCDSQCRGPRTICFANCVRNFLAAAGANCACGLCRESTLVGLREL